MRTLTLLPLALVLGATSLLLSASAPGETPALDTSTEAAEYAVDGTHSSIMFHIVHMDVAPFYGRFNKVSGDVVVDADPTQCSVKVSIESGSVDTNSEGRDKHLRGPDFLDAVQFPEIAFESTSVKLKDEDAKVYAVTGTLKLHGVEKEVTIDMTMSGPNETRRGTKAGFGGKLVINRRDYEITTYGNDSISDEVTLFFGIEANKK